MVAFPRPGVGGPALHLAGPGHFLGRSRRGQVGSAPGRPGATSSGSFLRLFSLSLLSSRLCLLRKLLESNFHRFHSRSLRLQCQLVHVCFLCTRVRGWHTHACKHQGRADVCARPQVKAGHPAPRRDPSRFQRPHPEVCWRQPCPPGACTAVPPADAALRGVRALLCFALCGVEPHVGLYGGGLFPLVSRLEGAAAVIHSRGRSFLCPVSSVLCSPRVCTPSDFYSSGQASRDGILKEPSPFGSLFLQSPHIHLNLHLPWLISLSFLFLPSSGLFWGNVKAQECKRGNIFGNSCFHPLSRL